MISYVTVGAEVGFARSGSWGGYVSTGFGKVIKINGHGHITVDTGNGVKVFDKFGNERGTNYGVRLVEASVLRQRLKEDNDRKERTLRVRTLIRQLEGTFGHNGTAHIDDEAKREFIKMIEAL